LAFRPFLNDTNRDHQLSTPETRIRGNLFEGADMASKETPNGPFVSPFFVSEQVTLSIYRPDFEVFGTGILPTIFVFECHLDTYSGSHYLFATRVRQRANAILVQSIKHETTPRIRFDVLRDYCAGFTDLR